jgi:hypothetical protein
MTQSICEQVIQAVMTTLTPVAVAAKATLIRSPIDPLSREQTPALLVFIDGETILESTNNVVKRTLNVTLVAVARRATGAGVTTARNEADALLVAAHAALYESTALKAVAGYKNLPVEMSTDETVRKQEAICLSLQKNYQLTYMTRRNSISTPA